MSKGPVYDLTEAWQQNINAVRNKPLQRRAYIEKWAARTGMSAEVAWHWFCTDDMAAAHFAKDPRKQSAHENIAAAWIKKLPGVYDFQQLKRSGPKALYVSKGQVLRQNDVVLQNTPKSIDFYWKMALPGNHRILHVYASHKHTAEDGGSQDNQLEDLKQFVKEATCLEDECGVRFLALSDGDYYTKPRGPQRTYLDDLVQLSQASSYVRALPCVDLPLYLATCLQKLAGSLAPDKYLTIQNELNGLVERLTQWENDEPPATDMTSPSHAPAVSVEPPQPAVETPPS